MFAVFMEQLDPAQHGLQHNRAVQRCRSRVIPRLIAWFEAFNVVLPGKETLKRCCVEGICMQLTATCEGSGGGDFSAMGLGD